MSVYQVTDAVQAVGFLFLGFGVVLLAVVAKDWLNFVRYKWNNPRGSKNERKGKRYEPGA